MRERGFDHGERHRCPRYRNRREDRGGEGTGDMSAAVYDPDGSIANAGGIAAWIDAHYENAEEGSY